MTETGPQPYRDDDEHLADELRRLDLALSYRVTRLRDGGPANRSTEAGVVSDVEADRLLEPRGEHRDSDELEQRLQAIRALDAQIEQRVRASRRRDIDLALVTLRERFSLSSLETRAVVACFAPEVDPRYGQLYAYLQGDSTRDRPNVELLLDLLCCSQDVRRLARQRLADQGTLVSAPILEPIPNPHAPTAQPRLRLDARILGLLRGIDDMDGRLDGLVQLLPADDGDRRVFVDPAVASEVTALVEHVATAGGPDRRRLVVSLVGPPGVGRSELAHASCARLGLPLLTIDVKAAMKRDEPFERLVKLALREALLQQAAVLVEGADVLLADDAQPELAAVARAAADYAWLVFLSGQEPWTQRAAFDAWLHSVTIPMPAAHTRRRVWTDRLAGHDDARSWADELAVKFRLTPSQILGAADAAELIAATRRGTPPLGLADLHRACREQSQHRLGELAGKVEPHAGWADLILPADQIEQLHEICAQVRLQAQVLGEWGFERNATRGRGVSVLFSGAPGTGKTLATEVLAAELDLALYKVDLSGVVSKYVGETEKNLSRIFSEAENSNCILFFDEADALFGQRTKVSDAHDRYANVETSYLLQRMEEHDGTVVLATNLRENVDEAFTRRLRFVVEFPFPDPESRHRIWAAHLPDAAPRSRDLDLEYLARELKVSGGSIRNIILNAAYLAASNGKVIRMDHVMRATRREFEKTGKVWAAS